MAFCSAMFHSVSETTAPTAKPANGPVNAHPPSPSTIRAAAQTTVAPPATATPIRFPRAKQSAKRPKVRIDQAVSRNSSTHQIPTATAVARTCVRRVQPRTGAAKATTIDPPSATGSTVTMTPAGSSKETS